MSRRLSRAAPRRALLLAGMCVALGIAAAGSQRSAAGAADGTGLLGAEGDRPPADGRLRIGTFNIHRGRGNDGRRDLNRTAETLRGLDLAALNEVSGPGLTPGSDQAEILGKTLGWGWLFAPTEQRWWRADFGNGLVSRFPIREWSIRPLPGPRKPPFRNIVAATLPWGEVRIRLLATHIDPRRDGGIGLPEVLRRFRDLEPPAILLGDLNVGPEHPTMKELLAKGGIRDPLRDKLGKARPRTIDWVLTRGFLTQDAGLRDLGASDHSAVWAELTLAPVSHKGGGMAAPTAR